MKTVDQPEFSGLVRKTARKAKVEDLLLAHSQEHIDKIFAAIPKVGLNFIDGDTLVSPGSGEAALNAVGSVLDAVDNVIAEKNSNAFCAVRPPGHHAHRDHAEGFCLFNNIAIGALSALKHHGLKRVAIVDFDVHHGNGTQDIMWNEENVLFVSTHQAGIYPGSGFADQKGAYNNIMNFSLPAGTDGAVFREIMESQILPRLNEFGPEMIFVSAGYDAHKDDPLAQFIFTEDDFAYAMTALVRASEELCEGRLVAVLEGGYDLAALAKSVAASLEVMMKEKGHE